mmetsp:Transcript_26958/g.39666  ORF Transcript_26958/g.39666 Transcript_26958/m.39666 type:complete len:83 (+) Transcript_26958:1064-1312(+)
MRDFSYHYCRRCVLPVIELAATLVFFHCNLFSGRARIQIYTHTILHVHTHVCVWLCVLSPSLSPCPSCCAGVVWIYNIFCQL